jgi:hypothetical protein
VNRAALPELARLRALIDALPAARPEILAEVADDDAGDALPLYAVTVGRADPAAPTLIVVGGVHGLEQIGAQVALALLASVTARLSWDVLLDDALARVRLAFVPLVNPIGIRRRTRANGRGVDLMRNAPDHPAGWGTPVVGGQRLSRRLPWYRGEVGELEPEARALIDFVERTAFGARLVVSLDLHSGFGFADRLWFPYARTRAPFPHIAELDALHGLLERALPHHVYTMEPQATVYTAQGDLWDHLHDHYAAARPGGTFLPLTLEMGSWAWVRKNPRQLLDPLGGFNPILPHRERRTLRRHLPLFELLIAAVASGPRWAELDPAARARHEDAARRRWF